MNFKKEIIQGIPSELPSRQRFDNNVNHAPIRECVLSHEEKKLSLKNALRYFDQKFHKELIEEFSFELKKYGRIYMYRFRPEYEMYARPIADYPHKSKEAAAIMLMIQNNLDKRVAQHPH